ncbi:MAG: AAA family ATPase [Alsobacter sp.]
MRRASRGAAPMTFRPEGPPLPAHVARLLGLGLRLFPARTDGKVPAIHGWQRRASAEPEAVRDLFFEYDPVLKLWRDSGFNVGVHTGQMTDGRWLTVVDVDVNEAKAKKGAESLAALVREHGDAWLDTFTVKTPSGGRHIYLGAPTPCQGCNSTALGPGIDVKAREKRGGLVIGPGSVYPAGTYTIEKDVPIADAPMWLVEKLGEARTVERDARPGIVDDSDANVDRAKEYLLGEEPAIEGRGGDRWTYTVACKVRDLGLSEVTALEVMWDHWNHRCEPPWDFEGLGTKVRNAYNYAEKPAGEKAVDFKERSEEDEREIQRLKAEVPRDEDVAKNETVAAPAIILPSIEDLYDPAQDFDTPPPREWAVEGLIPRRKVTLLTGDGGVGKTLAAQMLQTAAATGRPWFGREVVQGPTLGVWCEDDRHEIRLRQVAICAAMGTDRQAMIGARSWTSENVAAGAVLMEFTRDKPAGVTTDFAKRLYEVVGRLRPVFVFLDPIANMFAGSEIDRTQVTGFVNRVLNRMCVDFGTTVVAAAHPSVSGIAEGTGRSGSTAWGNAVRSRLYLLRGKRDLQGNIRILRSTKTNYGRLGEEIAVEWRAGAFHHLSGSEADEVQRARTIEAIVLAAIDAADENKSTVSPKDGARTYYVTLAEKAWAKSTGTWGLNIGPNKAEIEAAFDRLRVAKILHIVEVRDNGRVTPYVRRTGPTPRPEDDYEFPGDDQ